MANKKRALMLLIMLSIVESHIALKASSCCSCLRACFPGLFDQKSKRTLDKESEELREMLQTPVGPAPQPHQNSATSMYLAALDTTLEAQSSLQQEEVAQFQHVITISQLSQPTLARSPSVNPLNNVAIATVVTHQQKKGPFLSFHSQGSMSPISHSSTQPPSKESSQDNLLASTASPLQLPLMPSPSASNAGPQPSPQKIRAIVQSASAINVPSPHQPPLIPPLTLPPHQSTNQSPSPNSSNTTSPSSTINDGDEHCVVEVMTPNGQHLSHYQKPTLADEFADYDFADVMLPEDKETAHSQPKPRPPTPSLADDDDDDADEQEIDAYFHPKSEVLMSSTHLGLTPLSRKR